MCIGHTSQYRLSYFNKRCFTKMTYLSILQSTAIPSISQTTSRQLTYSDWRWPASPPSLTPDCRPAASSCSSSRKPVYNSHCPAWRLVSRLAGSHWWNYTWNVAGNHAWTSFNHFDLHTQYSHQKYELGQYEIEILYLQHTALSAWWKLNKTSEEEFHKS